MSPDTSIDLTPIDDDDPALDAFAAGQKPATPENGPKFNPKEILNSFLANRHFDRQVLGTKLRAFGEKLGSWDDREGVKGKVGEFAKSVAWGAATKLVIRATLTHFLGTENAEALSLATGSLAGGITAGVRDFHHQIKEQAYNLSVAGQKLDELKAKTNRTPEEEALYQNIIKTVPGTPEFDAKLRRQVIDKTPRRIKDLVKAQGESEAEFKARQDAIKADLEAAKQRLNKKRLAIAVGRGLVYGALGAAVAGAARDVFGDAIGEQVGQRLEGISDTLGNHRPDLGGIGEAIKNKAGEYVDTLGWSKDQLSTVKLPDQAAVGGVVGDIKDFYSQAIPEAPHKMAEALGQAGQGLKEDVQALTGHPIPSHYGVGELPTETVTPATTSTPVLGGGGEAATATATATSTPVSGGGGEPFHLDAGTHNPLETTRQSVPQGFHLNPGEHNPLAAGSGHPTTTVRHEAGTVPSHHNDAGAIGDQQVLNSAFQHDYPNPAPVVPEVLNQPVQVNEGSTFDAGFHHNYDQVYGNEGWVNPENGVTQGDVATNFVEQAAQVDGADLNHLAAGSTSTPSSFLTPPQESVFGEIAQTHDASDYLSHVQPHVDAVLADPNHFPAGVSEVSTPADASVGVNVPDLTTQIQHAFPEGHLTITSDTPNVWSAARAGLTQILHQPPTDDQVLKVTLGICQDNNIADITLHTTGDTLSSDLQVGDTFSLTGSHTLEALKEIVQ